MSPASIAEGLIRADGTGRHDVAKSKTRQYPPALLDLMACKTAILMMGMEQAAQPMWAAAAGYEERIAPRLDALGRSLEAAPTHDRRDHRRRPHGCRLHQRR